MNPLYNTGLSKLNPLEMLFITGEKHQWIVIVCYYYPLFFDMLSLLTMTENSKRTIKFLCVKWKI